MSKANHADWTTGGPNSYSGFSTTSEHGNTYSLSTDFSGASVALAVATVSVGLGAAGAAVASACAAAPG